MRKLTGPDFDRYRIEHPFGSCVIEKEGAFWMRGPCGKMLSVIACSGEGWDHVSVSLETRAPWWKEMDWIKRHFFYPEEVVMQLHVAESDHINFHPYVLHLWRPHDHAIPLPPKEFV